MSTETNSKKRTLKEIDDDDEGEDVTQNQVDNAMNDDDDVEELEEPPLKKQKLSNETNTNCLYEENTNTNTRDTMPCVIQINDDLNPLSSSNPRNDAIILMAGSMNKMEIDTLCMDLQSNNIQISTEKTFSMNEDELNHLFFECTESSINTVDMIESGMFDEFKDHNKNNKVMIVTNHSNDIYIKLRIFFFSKSYHKDQDKKKQIYVTLNYEDYLFKSKLLFFREVRHSIFWNEFNEKNQSFIGSDHSLKHENELNTFYEQTTMILEMEKESMRIKCCCSPIIMSLNSKYGQKYREMICENGINGVSMKCYQKAIERSCNIYGGQYISIGGHIMESIWIFLGKVVCSEKNDKTNISSFDCEHCKNKMNFSFKINEIKKEKEKKEKQKKEKEKKNKKKNKVIDSEKDKFCEICKKLVPNNEHNWKQHIDGKKHKKKAAKLVKK